MTSSNISRVTGMVDAVDGGTAASRRAVAAMIAFAVESFMVPSR
jgi:hypothetical protein